MHDLFGCFRSRPSETNSRLVALVIASSLVALLSGCGTSTPTGFPAASPRMVEPLPVSAARMARLPGATTFGRLRGAPLDPDPFSPETGVLIHPRVAQVVYAYPGGQPVAVLPATELSSPTWVPVVQSRPGWDRVLLPTRPNRSTGWIFLGGSGLQTAYSAYRIEISLAAYRLTVLDRGRRLGSWTVAVGAQSTPTPTGRTFLLASVAPRHPTYSPLILPLGVHSHTLSSFGGGPGTVGLHGWPDPSVFGHAVSHGCVRVPPAALRVLSRIPLGSPVVITS
jgi:lipoprotein-anchoring transpeptidase ErfK/SrfK